MCRNCNCVNIQCSYCYAKADYKIPIVSFGQIKEIWICSSCNYERNNS